MNYNIELPEEQIGLVARALMELPYKSAAPILDSINRQISEQQAAQAPAEPQEKPAPAESE